MKEKLVQLSVAAALCAAVAACATKAPVPHSELALTDSAFKSAESAGAQEYAPLKLRAAREKKAEAEKALAEKNYLKAKYLSIQAQADAEVARAAADAEKSRLALKEAQHNMEMIRQELHKTNSSDGVSPSSLSTDR
ncbi:MAG: DUF4398 domain-containing protein [Granulosicoccus sp.]